MIMKIFWQFYAQDTKAEYKALALPDRPACTWCRSQMPSCRSNDNSFQSNLLCKFPVTKNQLVNYPKMHIKENTKQIYPKILT